MRQVSRTRVSALAALLAATATTSCGGEGGSRPATEYQPPVPAVSVEEYSSRRDVVLETLSDGILLLQARPVEKGMEQWGFVQDPTFLYYSGLPEAPGAILALDGPAGEAHLFLPPPPSSFGMTVEGLTPVPSEQTANDLRLESARPWSDFMPWVEGRMVNGVARLYLDESRNAESQGVPEGMAPVAGPRTLWSETVRTAFPAARIESAKSAIMRQRSVKSPAEIRILERNAHMTVEALLAASARLEPGVRQRQTEASVISACLEAGAQGPSFWPWTMSGPNAHTPRLVGAFFRYDQGDRVAWDGEVVRVDIGCAGGLYGADVGRTLPVSGEFSAGQAEAWDILVEGYLAGLDAMADGAAVADVRAASMAAVQDARDRLVTDEGRAAAKAILDGGPGTWHIHGVGLDSGEDIPDPLLAGMVVAYEPGFSIGPDAYYLEDMILVTNEGHRVLSSGLPYTASEISDAMDGR
jgi:Xaa-Pro aminopeptidase